MRRNTLACFLLVLSFSAPAWSKERPNLSGHWEINVKMSNYGKMPVPSVFTEIIDHKEPNLTISNTSRTRSGDKKVFMRLTTDGKESLNEASGSQFQTQSQWSAGKLIIIITDTKGLRITEIRSLSPDGKTQTVEDRLQGAAGIIKMIRVMEKK